MTDSDLILKAKKKVKAKRRFYSHMVVTITLSLFFFIINVATRGGEPWFIFPTLALLLILLIHYISVFGFPKGRNWDTKQLEREVKALRKQKEIEELENEKLELKEIIRINRSYRDDDLV